MRKSQLIFVSQKFPWFNQFCLDFDIMPHHKLCPIYTHASTGTSRYAPYWYVFPQHNEDQVNDYIQGYNICSSLDFGNFYVSLKKHHFHGLAQDCGNSIANAMELPESNMLFLDGLDTDHLTIYRG